MNWIESVGKKEFIIILRMEAVWVQYGIKVLSLGMTILML